MLLGYKGAHQLCHSIAGAGSRIRRCCLSLHILSYHPPTDSASYYVGFLSGSAPNEVLPGKQGFACSLARPDTSLPRIMKLPRSRLQARQYSNTNLAAANTVRKCKNNKHRWQASLDRREQRMCSLLPPFQVCTIHSVNKCKCCYLPRCCFSTQ